MGKDYDKGSKSFPNPQNSQPLEIRESLERYQILVNGIAERLNERDEQLAQQDAKMVAFEERMKREIAQLSLDFHNDIEKFGAKVDGLSRRLECEREQLKAQSVEIEKLEIAAENFWERRKQTRERLSKEVANLEAIWKAGNAHFEAEWAGLLEKCDLIIEKQIEKPCAERRFAAENSLENAFNESEIPTPTTSEKVYQPETSNVLFVASIPAVKTQQENNPVTPANANVSNSELETLLKVRALLQDIKNLVTRLINFLNELAPKPKFDDKAPIVFQSAMEMSMWNEQRQKSNQVTTTEAEYKSPQLTP